MNKDAIIEAFEQWDDCPEDYDKLPKEEQDRIFNKFMQDYLEGQVCQAEAMEDR